jgi:molybdate transport system substrate-binding protein
MNRRRLIAALAAMTMTARPPALAAGRIIVFAAASLKNALEEIGAVWTAASGHEVKFSFAASSALAKQIEQGAPADSYFPADLDWMTYLAERKLVDEATIVKLLGNEIVLIAQRDSPLTAKIAPGFPLADILASGRLAMADVKAVPAGRYGRQALDTLGVWPGVAGKVAQAENVRAALKLVAVGEAPLGIVYRSDAIADPQVRILDTFPAHTHAPIVYPVARTSDSASPVAKEFLAYLQTDSARELFQRQGFTVLAPAAGN